VNLHGEFHESSFYRCLIHPIIHLSQSQSTISHHNYTDIFLCLHLVKLKETRLSVHREIPHVSLRIVETIQIHSYDSGFIAIDSLQHFIVSRWRFTQFNRTF
jgi:hypothetical protein